MRIGGANSDLWPKRPSLVKSGKLLQRTAGLSREAAFRARSTERPLLNQRSLHIKPLQRCLRLVVVVQSNPWLQKLGVLILVYSAA
jgi:hypothetical protein